MQSVISSLARTHTNTCVRCVMYCAHNTLLATAKISIFFFFSNGKKLSSFSTLAKKKKNDDEHGAKMRIVTKYSFPTQTKSFSQTKRAAHCHCICNVLRTAAERVVAFALERLQCLFIERSTHSHAPAKMSIAIAPATRPTLDHCIRTPKHTQCSQIILMKSTKKFRHDRT